MFEGEKLMAGYSKLWSTIVTSSIWTQDDRTLRVWIAMMAMCDAEGVVDGSIPGFARICGMSVEEFKDALSVLMSPDPHSRSPEFDGRRLAEERGRGWRILTYQKHRDGFANTAVAIRQRRSRDRRKAEIQDRVGDEAPPPENPSLSMTAEMLASQYSERVSRQLGQRTVREKFEALIETGITAMQIQAEIQKHEGPKQRIEVWTWIEERWPSKVAPRKWKTKGEEELEEIEAMRAKGRKAKEVEDDQR